VSYLLYRLHGSGNDSERENRPKVDGEIIVFSPFSTRWLLPALRAGGIDYLKAVLMAVWCQLTGVSGQRSQQVWAYVAEDRSVLHYSIVVQTSMHMPWLTGKESGIEIGACVTIPRARGNGIYPFVLGRISSVVSRTGQVYMIVEESNKVSRAGMERSGFELAHKLSRRTGLLRPPVYEVCSNA